MRELQGWVSQGSQFTTSSNEPPTNLGMLLLHEKGPVLVSALFTLISNRIANKKRPAPKK